MIDPVFISLKFNAFSNIIDSGVMLSHQGAHEVWLLFLASMLLTINDINSLGVAKW